MGIAICHPSKGAAPDTFFRPLHRKAITTWTRFPVAEASQPMLEEATVGDGRDGLPGLEGKPLPP